MTIRRHNRRPPGFTIMESFAMLAAIFVFTWICLAIAKKEGLILSSGKKAGQSANSSQPASPEPPAEDGKK